jgi:hypothetical protein
MSFCRSRELQIEPSHVSHFLVKHIKNELLSTVPCIIVAMFNPVANPAAKRSLLPCFLSHPSSSFLAITIAGEAAPGWRIGDEELALEFSDAYMQEFRRHAHARYVLGVELD